MTIANNALNELYRRGICGLASYIYHHNEELIAGDEEQALEDSNTMLSCADLISLMFDMDMLDVVSDAFDLFYAKAEEDNAPVHDSLPYAKEREGLNLVSTEKVAVSTIDKEAPEDDVLLADKITLGVEGNDITLVFNGVVTLEEEPAAELYNLNFGSYDDLREFIGLAILYHQTEGSDMTCPECEIDRFRAELENINGPDDLKD